MSTKLVEAMVNIQEDEALQIMKKAIDEGENSYIILNDCQEAMKIVGEKFEKGEYFLPELIACGEMLKKISDIVKPGLVAAQKMGGSEKRGKIVIGTVRGDIHNIGKDIVKLVLEGNGFEIRDLGVDVPEEVFVTAVKEVQPQIVAMSGILTLAYDAMKSTVEALEKAGLRKKVKVMIGGGQAYERVRDYVKADAYGVDAMAAVRLANQWIPAQ